MTTRWDPSRDYDSQTFSEDYNLHGASERSLDHPSVTRDDNFFKALRLQGRDYVDEGDNDVDYSLENADLDLIADIVDGKAPHQNSTRGRRPLRGTAYQADDNSVASLLRYVVDGTQDEIDYYDSPAFDPTRPPTAGPCLDQLTPLTDEANEDRFREWSSSTPKRQTKSAQNNKGITHDQTKHATKGPIAGTRSEIREATEDKGFKSSVLKSSIPTRAVTGPTALSMASSERTSTAIERNDAAKDRKGAEDRNTNVKEIPKPAVRSAMKAPNSGSNNTGTQTKSKLVRHIQLPTELLDDSDQEEDISPRIEIEANNKDVDHEEQKQNELEVPTTVVTAAPTVPGPSKFTRISKKNVSPIKKPIATIPTPQDEGNEQVRKTVPGFKGMLEKLGLCPLTKTLESALDELDEATVEKGGLCEMMSLLERLGNKYEEKQEIIHQLTDQIIDGAERTRPDPEAERRIQEMGQELETVNRDLSNAQDRYHAVESRCLDLEAELERIQTIKEDEAKTASTGSEKRTLLDAASQVSGTWASSEDLLKRRDESSTSPTMESQHSTETTPVNWWKHVKRIEQELKALKSVLDHTPTSGSQAMSEDTDELVDRLDAENQRLQLKNRELTKRLLSLREDIEVLEQKGNDSKYKSLLKTVMKRIGVESYDDILPALTEIERILQDVPNLRRFVAKAEKIVWESEILEGTVKVQKGIRGGDKDYGDEMMFRAGKTCNMSLDETLQRLKEWSELLDVLNHVEFADDLEETATLVQS
ncbi:hypothetical protein BGX28_001011 [Mortierella sp. GBA30]|nr:hypothetical protein BGX28_001011 [Mortierella sp. GBA30]